MKRIFFSFLVIVNICVLLLVGSFTGAYGQNVADTLTLDMAIERIMQNYPTVRQAQEAVYTAGVNIKIARSVLQPILEASASYTRVEPVIRIPFEGRDMLLSAKDNYNAGVSLRQLIYDFGKSRSSIDAAKKKEELSRIQMDELRQGLALNTVEMYYMTSLVKESILIKEEELANYEEMLRQTELMAASGSATQFDVLNTKVRCSSIKSQIINLKSSQNTQITNLSVFTDTLISELTYLDNGVEVERCLTPLPDFLERAYFLRPEMQIAKKELELAELEERVARRQFNPSLDLTASAGGKNGYPIVLERMHFNYSVGASLSIPLYEGGRRGKEVAVAKSKIRTATEELNLIKRNIHQQVAGDFYALESSFAVFEQLGLQVALARSAFQQAQVNYQAGSITNLELLTSATNLSNAELQLLQARVDYQLARYHLKVSTGEIIY
ncbi:MAG: TolC family protein [Bacteroidales bacterium]|nr:TolC family protein [Bacteroidales bacterium]